MSRGNDVPYVVRKEFRDTMRMGVDLHWLSRIVNLSIPLSAVVCLGLALVVSHWFYLPFAILALLVIVNFYFRHLQHDNALLRNFGVLAEGRFVLESLGPELRQYLYLSDTEEKPFNRIERNDVYRKAMDEDAALSFGSQGQFDASEVKIRHSMFPVSHDQLEPFSVTFGEERNCPNAYRISKPMMISAMSYGALGGQAIRSLARGAKQAGIPMNTGEGGYPKYHLMEGCDLIFQMGTAKFGVRNDDGTLNDSRLRQLADEDSVKMIEIKLSQGAKPGKGGLLPKEKISAEIAQLRGVPQGRDVISPPSHVECTDYATTVEFIKRVQDVSELPVGIKMCYGSCDEFRTLARTMLEKEIFPDWIAIDGAEGGTGAAPKSFMDQVGVPLLPGLHTAHQTLEDLQIRDRTKLIGGGKLINAGRMIVAMAVGANACYSARGFMLALGCIQALQCGRNTCPVGITTHDPSLQRGLDIDLGAHRIENYVHHVMHDYEQLMSATGSRSPKDLDWTDLYIPEETDLAQIVFGQDRPVA